jgi:hypothetical protein
MKEVVFVVMNGENGDEVNVVVVKGARQLDEVGV